jgi:hypothetical protein
MAWKETWQGGEGRANAILALALDDLKQVYRSIPMDRRSGPVRVGEHQLDGNVLAILEEIDQSQYQRYIRQSQKDSGILRRESDYPLQLSKLG